MGFQVGEKVVYPNHGIGTVENISSRFSVRSKSAFTFFAFPQPG